MAVSETFRSFVLEQLNQAVPPVRGRSMFGGVGLYSGDSFFALISGDVLYFKTDESSQKEFESRGMTRFQPFGAEGSSMHYHQLPEDVLEDPESLRVWAERAIAVARRTKSKPSRRRRP